MHKHDIFGWYSKSVRSGTTTAGGADGIDQISEVDATWGASSVVFPRIQGADVAGRIVELDLRTLYLKDLEMHGATVMQVGIFEKLVGYIEHGEIRPLLAKKFPISRIKKAQEEFLNKKHLGNFSILPWQ